MNAKSVFRHDALAPITASVITLSKKDVCVYSSFHTRRTTAIDVDLDLRQNKTAKERKLLI